VAAGWFMAEYLNPTPLYERTIFGQIIQRLRHWQLGQCRLIIASSTSVSSTSPVAGLLGNDEVRLPGRRQFPRLRVGDAIGRPVSNYLVMIGLALALRWSRRPLNYILMVV